MAGLKRRMLGIAVISAGVCAALPFRNEAVNAPADPRAAVEFPDAAAVRDELTLQLTIPTTPVADPITVSGQQATPAVAEKKPTPQPQELRRDELQAPPKIASAFQPLVAAFPAAKEEATTTNFDKPEQRHRIADGDTLDALAERYLGNRNQWRSIYEANDGLLSDRDILPIGKEINIPHVPTPSRAVVRWPSKAIGPPDSTALEGHRTERYDDDHLVPIPPGLLNRE